MTTVAQPECDEFVQKKRKKTTPIFNNFCVSLLRCLCSKQRVKLQRRLTTGRHLSTMMHAYGADAGGSQPEVNTELAF